LNWSRGGKDLAPACFYRVTEEQVFRCYRQAGSGFPPPEPN
jgi:hypothetical protein